MDVGVVEVVETPGVVDAEEFEDVFYAGAGFHVGGVVHGVGAVGELVEAGFAGCGVVFTCQVSPQAAEAEDFAPL